MSKPPKSSKNNQPQPLDEWARICACLSRITKHVSAVFAALAQILKEIQTLRPNAEGTA